MRRYITIFGIVIGIAMLFLIGCKKSSSDTIAFVGDESDMRSCQDVYSIKYFNDITNLDPKTAEGMFPPDITGEYELEASLLDGTYARYNQSYGDYMVVQTFLYSYKGIRFSIVNQVNGMATIKISIKNNISSNFGKPLETTAYIFGDVFSTDANKRSDFIFCFEDKEDPGTASVYKAYTGSIIAGTVETVGGVKKLKDIKYYTVYKNVEYKALVQQVPREGGHAFYSCVPVE